MIPTCFKRVPVVLQTTLTDCAPACLAMILAAHRRPVALDRLRDELGAGRDGVRGADVRAVAARYGLGCRAWRVAPGDLPSTPVPFMAHWEGDHFVVVTDAGERRVRFVDPALGRRALPAAEFAKRYSGVALTFTADEPPAPDHPAPPAPAWRRVLVPVLGANRRALAVLAAAATLLLAVGLAVPVLTATLVDRLVAAAGASPEDAARSVLVAIAAVALAVGGLSLARGVAAAAIQQGVGRDLTGSLVDRLLDAPLLFFEHRGRGDIISRTMATEAVRDAVATQLVAAVLDAVTAVGYLAVVLVADIVLGGVTAALAAVQLAVLGVLAAGLRRLRREELQADARVHGWLLETVAGIAWLKAAGAEPMARQKWAGLHDTRLRALRRSAHVGAVADAVAATVRLAGPLVLLAVAVGARGLADRHGTGGTVGLTALATAALLPCGALAGHLRSFQELGSVVTHLGDLVTAPAEQEPGRVPAPVLEGALTARSLRFRHTPRSPWVVDDVDLDVAPGAKLAVVGASGSGKSTLARLLVGLYRPTEGEVRLDGTPLDDVELRSLRRQLGVVLQEPFLMTGTLRENIALRRPDASLEEVAEAARLAAIHDEIAALPMGYATVVAEGGAGLSGGQRQRIALARALLDRPAVVVLDEATSHLDAATEARVEANLRALGVTRIVIAHRLSTVRDADQIVVMEAGRIAEAGPPTELAAADGPYARLLDAQGDHGLTASSGAIP